MHPKRLVDIDDDSLTVREAAQVLHGESDIKARRSRSWRAVKGELGV
jgi:hypothetical protein